ncbi:FkbM family methyltransferase [Streptomyces sp. NPDC015171]|uniref:FkbM family methyltransferase n=1 Tax=Streptomyces sp. NPDC015171 TaxID=3364945 RepID=UPI0036FA2BFB
MSPSTRRRAGRQSARPSRTAPAGLRFTYYPEAPGNSGLDADRTADDEISLIFLRNSGVAPEDAAEMVEGLHEGVECTVPALTVSDLLRRHAVSRVDLLKVDVERAELDVLRGIEDLHWPLIHTVVVEVHDRPAASPPSRTCCTATASRWRCTRILCWRARACTSWRPCGSDDRVGTGRSGTGRIGRI